MEVITKKRENGTTRVSYKTSKDSNVEQKHKNDVNINTIIKRALKTGMAKQNLAEARFGDFSSGLDFQATQDRIIEAQNDFNALPSYIRNRFDNDPGALISFMADPENVEEARELGLVAKDEPEALDVGTPVNVAPEATEAPPTDGGS